MHNYLNNLNPEQLQAVTHINGPAICIAGPGSGKTTVLISRLRYMLNHFNIAPSSILVVTFTKEAAKNMQARFSTDYNSNNNINFSTFHSIFYNMLKLRLGPENLSILSEEKAIKVLKSILQGRHNILASNNDFLRQILHEISKFKSSLKNLSNYSPEFLSNQQFISIYNDYMQYLKHNNLVDFEDILNMTYHMLVNEPAFLKYWQNRFKYILIDEFQDINPLQFYIIKLIASPHNNLFVVGDDDQSIYAFRGANPKMMIDFPTHYPDCRTFYLLNNYRSQAHIVQAASTLISHNLNRYKKNLRPVNPLSTPIQIKSFATRQDEFTYIASSIKKLADTCSYSDIAILFRTNSDIDKILHTLLYHNIPFKTKTSIPCLFDNSYLAPLIAMLRFANGSHSRENFLKFYNKPTRYISRESLKYNYIDLKELEKHYVINQKYYVASNIKKLCQDLNLISKLSPELAVKYIRNHVGYDKYLEKELSASDRSYQEAITTLDDFLLTASSFNSLSDFLDYIDNYKLATDNKIIDDNIPAVNILTYHGCKGLEYKHVFIPACQEGITPWKLSKSPDELEEERRMFYVAMTRAIESLTLSFCKKYGNKELAPSRFIKEIQ